MKRVIKKDLIEAVSDDAGFTREQVTKVLESFLEKVTNELSDGNSVVLRNFGAFEVKETKARVAHNPQNTAQKVSVPRRAVVKFKPGKAMKQQVMLALPKLK